MSSDATYRKEPAMSKASVKEVVVGTAGTGSAVVVELPLRWPAELKPGNEALKSARSSSGGFCELLLGEKVVNNRSARGLSIAGLRICAGRDVSQERLTDSETLS